MGRVRQMVRRRGKWLTQRPCSFCYILPRGEHRRTERYGREGEKKRGEEAEREGKVIKKKKREEGERQGFSKVTYRGFSPAGFRPPASPTHSENQT